MSFGNSQTGILVLTASIALAATGPGRAQDARPTLPHHVQPTNAGQLQRDQASSPSARRIVIPDVVLSEQGVLTVHVVDAQGRPHAGAPIQLLQGNRKLIELRTSERGLFQVRLSRGGVYQIGTGTRRHGLRVWVHGTAPRSARPHALIVHDRRPVRGHLIDTIPPIDGVTTLELLLIGGATWWGIEAWNNSRDNSPN